MASRLPTTKDFPSLTLSITPPPASQATANILILLHGLGDTQIPFTQLAKQLQLPYTTVISLRAPTPVPALFTGSDAPSFTWGDDVQFDANSGEMEMNTGFCAIEKQWNVLLRGLASCDVGPRDIHFMGFGQGGMAALYLAAKHDGELGGIISIGGSLPSSVYSAAKCKTPALVLGGSRSRVVTKQAVSNLKDRFTNVEYVKWTKEGDGMPRNRDEMLPLMKFWARTLASKAGVPEGAVEVGR